MHFIHMLETLNFVGKIIWKHVEEECQIIVSRYVCHCAFFPGLAVFICPILFFQTLEEVMKLRDRQYFDFRRMIAIRAKYFFIMMLNNRQYTGKIQFDHKKEILNLAVSVLRLQVLVEKLNKTQLITLYCFFMLKRNNVKFQVQVRRFLIRFNFFFFK